jgi:dTDP-4-amino-4,6-dideoxygalactose transaminase
LFFIHLNKNSGMQTMRESIVEINDIKAGAPIPFSPPFVDDDVIAEVVDTLQSGWITTGPKVRMLEEACAELSKCPECICVNSWTSGAQLVLKWWGVGPGDEVIVPAYTYAATALVVIHAGAKPVMVDVLDDFTIDPEEVRKAITPRTKAIIPVDIGGWPCDYTALQKLIEEPEIMQLFQAANNAQQMLGRLLLVADAAHSFGARYNLEPSAKQADITVYSFHAVKNLTTAEGGAVCLNLPLPFDNSEVRGWMKLNSMNGQTKDAFSKTKAGGWRYDIVSDGLKINMPDIVAAIGLAQIRRYEDCLLPARQRIFQLYQSLFIDYTWAQLPLYEDEKRITACHLYPLRISGITEAQRDAMIDEISALQIAVNVHFQPLPMLTYFRHLGYNISDYPSSYEQYSKVISLPIYPQLTADQVLRIVECVVYSYNKVCSAK